MYGPSRICAVRRAIFSGSYNGRDTETGVKLNQGTLATDLGVAESFISQVKKRRGMYDTAEMDTPYIEYLSRRTARTLDSGSDGAYKAYACALCGAGFCKGSMFAEHLTSDKHKALVANGIRSLSGEQINAYKQLIHEAHASDNGDKDAMLQKPGFVAFVYYEITRLPGYIRNSFDVKIQDIQQVGTDDTSWQRLKEAEEKVGRLEKNNQRLLFKLELLRDALRNGRRELVSVDRTKDLTKERMRKIWETLVGNTFYGTCYACGCEITVCTVYVVPEENDNDVRVLLSTQNVRLKCKACALHDKVERDKRVLRVRTQNDRLYVWVRTNGLRYTAPCFACRAEPVTFFSDWEMAHEKSAKDHGSGDYRNKRVTCKPCNRTCGPIPLVKFRHNNFYDVLDHVGDTEKTSDDIREMTSSAKAATVRNYMQRKRKRLGLGHGL